MATLTNSPAEATVLEVEARKSLAFTVEIATPSGVPADLTGASVGFVLGVGTTHVEVPAVIDMPASGRAVIMLQAATLALAPGAYPFVVVLRTGGYSLVLVKGDVKVKPNPEQLSAALEYGGANPATGLSVALVGLQVIKVTVWSGVPQGVDGGLDATGVADGYLPTAQGDGTWAWQPPATVAWENVTGTEAVVLRPELDAYAPLAGATFTGPVEAPEITVSGDVYASAGYVFADGAVITDVTAPTVRYVEQLNPGGGPVLYRAGATDPAPIDPAELVRKDYVDDLVADVASGISSGNRLVGFIQRTTDTADTTGQQVEILSTTVNVVSGLRYRLSLSGMTDGSDVNNVASIELWAGSTKLQQWSARTNSSTQLARFANGFNTEGYWLATTTGPVVFRATITHISGLGSGSDRVLGGAQWPPSLAVELLDESPPVGDTGWRPCTVTGAWTNEASAPLIFRKIGVAVYGRGRITATFAPDTTYTVGNTPGAEFNPPNGQSTMSAVFTTGAFVGWCNVNALGQISIHFKSPWVQASGTIEFNGVNYLTT